MPRDKNQRDWCALWRASYKPRYVHPDAFVVFEREADARVFKHAAVGAMVRSSYHSGKQADGVVGWWGEPSYVDARLRQHVAMSLYCDWIRLVT